MKKIQSTIHFDKSNEELKFSIESEQENVHLLKKTQSSSEFSEYTSFNSRPTSRCEYHRNINTPIPGDNGDLNDTLDDDNNNNNNKNTNFKNKLANFKSCLPMKHFNYMAKFWAKYSCHLVYLKHLILLAYCITCVVLISKNKESQTDISFSQTILLKENTNRLTCYNTDHDSDSPSSGRFYRLVVNGPFVDVNEKNSFNDLSESFIKIHAHHLNESIISSWTLVVTNPNSIQHFSDVYSENFISVKNFQFDYPVPSNQLSISVKMNNLDSIAFNYNCTQLSDEYGNAILYSALLLVFVYILIIFEILHRSIAAALGAFGGIALLSLVNNERPSLHTIVCILTFQKYLL